MGTPNARPAWLAKCALSMSLVLLVLISSHGRHSEAQVHRGVQGETDFPQPAAGPSATGKGTVTEILAQLRALRGRIETLEMREKVLTGTRLGP